jgi:hypothetical protein
VLRGVRASHLSPVAQNALAARGLGGRALLSSRCHVMGISLFRRLLGALLTCVCVCKGIVFFCLVYLWLSERLNEARDFEVTRTL